MSGEEACTLRLKMDGRLMCNANANANAGAGASKAGKLRAAKVRHASRQLPKTMHEQKKDSALKQQLLSR